LPCTSTPANTLAKLATVAKVSNVWISPLRGEAMEQRERAMAIAGHGLDGCAHARPGTKRHVLFASAEHMRAVGVEPGTIKENFTVEGADVETWPVGQRVRVGEALFEVTMVCDPCSKMDEIRLGLQAELEGRRGMLAHVVESGTVAAGDEIELVG
jgi:MOSC domain-containing protein YiiM